MYESQTGLGTVTQYGARETGVSVGVERSTDSKHQLSFEFTGAELGSQWLPPLVIPKGATFRAATLSVDEAFAGLTGLAVGEGNDEATNGIELTLAQLAALGTVDVTSALAGEWAAAAQTTKAARIGIAVTGVPVATQGRASLVIEYLYKRRKDDEWMPDPGAEPAGYRPQFK